MEKHSRTHVLSVRNEREVKSRKRAQSSSCLSLETKSTLKPSFKRDLREKHCWKTEATQEPWRAHRRHKNLVRLRRAERSSEKQFSSVCVGNGEEDVPRKVLQKWQTKYRTGKQGQIWERSKKAIWRLASLGFPNQPGTQGYTGLCLLTAEITGLHCHTHPLWALKIIFFSICGFFCIDIYLFIGVI